MMTDIFNSGSAFRSCAHGFNSLRNVLAILVIKELIGSAQVFVHWEDGPFTNVYSLLD